jgi:hypothetical protein
MIVCVSKELKKEALETVNNVLKTLEKAVKENLPEDFYFDFCDFYSDWCMEFSWSCNEELIKYEYEALLKSKKAGKLAQIVEEKYHYYLIDKWETIARLANEGTFFDNNQDINQLFFDVVWFGQHGISKCEFDIEELEDEEYASIYMSNYEYWG